MNDKTKMEEAIKLFKQDFAKQWSSFKRLNKLSSKRESSLEFFMRGIKLGINIGKGMKDEESTS